jgi:hypothetical protein
VGVNIDQVTSAYKEFLASHYPGHLKKYKSTETHDLDAARFEAACFAILRARGLSVEIGESAKGGGPDFVCAGVSCRFVVEATTINTFAMENKTGMKDDQREVSGGFYEKFPTLYQKLIRKVKQVAKYEIPRMVCIGSFHNESLTLFRHVLEDEYFPVFFKRNDHGRLSPDETFKSISALALVGFGYDIYSAMGFLNPAPSHYFGIQFLPDIWFRQITEKGLADGTLLGQWVSTRTDTRPSFKFPLLLPELESGKA